MRQTWQIKKISQRSSPLPGRLQHHVPQRDRGEPAMVLSLSPLPAGEKTLLQCRRGQPSWKTHHAAHLAHRCKKTGHFKACKVPAPQGGPGITRFRNRAGPGEKEPFQITRPSSNQGKKEKTKHRSVVPLG